jgi:hypothetical protein
MVFQTFFIVDTHFGLAPLPYLALKSKLPASPEGEATLDELNALLDGRIGRDSEDQMNMIGHDDEIYDLKFSRTHVRA